MDRQNFRNLFALIVISQFAINRTGYAQVTPTATNNYIYTRTILKDNVKTQADLNALTLADVRAEVQYFDGLGRPLQSVSVQASPDNSKDLVTPVVYDAFGRQDKTYLPYAAGGTAGAYRSSAIADQGTFYSTATGSIPVIANPFSQTVFEASPLSRPLELGAPGAPWAIGQHTIKMGYEINAANEVRMWNVFGTGLFNIDNSAPATLELSNRNTSLTQYKASQSIIFKDGFSSQAGDNFTASIVPAWGNSAIGATSAGYYTAGQLYKNTTKDEHQSLVIEYKDKDGQVVCRKVQDGVDGGGNPTYMTTYYVYNDFNLLTYVIPPAVADNLTTFNETDWDFNNYIYAYHYDGRQRIVEKKIPGKGWDYTVYNLAGQPVYTQDAEQRNRGVWGFAKYDGLNRVIMTGEERPNTSTRDDLQTAVTTALANNTLSQWETVDLTKPYGYTTANAYPNSGNIQVFTVNYYDDYTILDKAGFNPYPGYFKKPAGLGASEQTKSLPTGTLTNILGTSTFLYAATYYDEKARVSKIIKQHQLGGVDIVTNTYNFVGEVTATTRQHYKDGALALTVSNAYEYDHAGRKKKNTETINNQTSNEVSYTYNAVGQLEVKLVGDQNISYVYNPRGWVTKQSSALFTEQLKYDDASQNPQYNGNIAQQLWTTNGQSHSYNYSYDRANRLLSGISDESYNETMSYDKMGNIQALTRQGVTGMPGLGTLTYNYGSSGNQLQSVTGGYNKTYSYNSNGSMISDGQLNIQYNELNLPKQVTGTPVGTVNYTYNATGGKLTKQTTSEIRQYIDGVEYVGTAIDLLHTEAGTARNNSGTFTYEYFLADHLGNTRIVHNGSGSVYQRTDYMPFGMEITRNGYGPNKYLYNGKEKQDELNQYDYGARFYDPVVGRWHIPDPISEEYRRWSVYNYAVNNPLRFTDPDGMGPEEIIIRGSNEFRQKTFRDLQGLTSSKLVMLANGKVVAANSAEGVSAKFSFTGAVGTPDRAYVAVDAAIPKPVGTEMINELINSDKVVTIQETSGGNETDAGSNTDLSNGKGTNSTIDYNPNGKGSRIVNEDGSTGRPPKIGLGHELSHAESNAKGTNDRAKASDMRDPDTRQKGTLSKEEVRARRVDSKIREENNVIRRAQPSTR